MHAPVGNMFLMQNTSVELRQWTMFLAMMMANLHKL